MPGIVEKASVIAVFARALDIAFENCGLHIVVEEAIRHPIERRAGSGFRTARPEHAR